MRSLKSVNKLEQELEDTDIAIVLEESSTPKLVVRETVAEFVNTMEESSYARSPVAGYINFAKSTEAVHIIVATVMRRCISKAARGEECNQSSVGRSETSESSVKIERGDHTLYTEGYE